MVRRTCQGIENAMKTFILRWTRDNSGAAAIEYGLIAALIAMTIIAGATAIGLAVTNQLTAVSSSVTAAGS